jgi:hypothetical protein
MTFRQGDKAWSADEIVPPDEKGRKRNLGRIGCLVTAIAEAARRSGDQHITPGTLLAKAKEKGEPGSKNAVFTKSGAAFLDRLAAVAGLEAPREQRVYLASGLDELRRVIRKTLNDGAFCTLHVDHDPRPDGTGNHFVLAIAIVDDQIQYADPATGREHFLSLSTLEGRAAWGGKTYRVVSAAPIFSPRAGRRRGCSLPG